jgi:formylglycine-generating enzyme required for sulfatase activity
MLSSQDASCDDRATAIPSKSTEEMLQRFVEECVLITPGTGIYPQQFEIGVEKPGENELPKKKASLSSGFRISKYEATQELYQAIVGRNPSRWKGPRNSVENVTWNDVDLFCKKLTIALQTRKLIQKNEIVRLPTAVEWEYCCRAGSNERFCFGPDAGDEKSDTAVLDQYAWHTGNAAGNDPAVGVLKPNAWGLCDVHGYLWEFVASAESDDGLEEKTLEKGNAPKRQIRGGSWRDHHSLLSSSTYLTISDDTANDATGFRCVIAVDHPAKNMPHR